tara:strand:- start:8484 stop:9047 length:564 start_codon:yes stop_codon:yes gene_type:complete
MSNRTIFLIIYRGQTGQRAHFGIWVPYEEDGEEGTVIHVVGAPMAGFSLEFKRRYSPKETARRPELVPLGSVNAQYVHKFEGNRGSDTTPQGNLEQVAAQVPPPRASANFLAPVNDVSTKGSVECEITNAFRQRTADARSGLWIMSVDSLAFTTSTNQRYRQCNRNETHLMLALAYGLLLLVHSRHQ